VTNEEPDNPQDRWPIVLVTAGTDPSGGAGLPADARACEAHACWAYGIVTGVVVQSTLGVDDFETLNAALVEAQLDSALRDIQPAAVKTGMLGSVAVARAISDRVRAIRYASESVPWVVDPVLASGAGSSLRGAGLVEGLRRVVLPLTTVLTPNVPEAAALLELPPDAITDEAAMCDAAERLLSLGPEAVLLKGGHVAGAPGDALAVTGHTTEFLRNEEVLPGLDIHGTGCHLASAVASELAHGATLRAACTRARRTLSVWIRRSHFSPGKGRAILGPQLDRPSSTAADGQT